MEVQRVSVPQSVQTQHKGYIVLEQTRVCGERKGKVWIGLKLSLKILKGQWVHDMFKHRYNQILYVKKQLGLVLLCIFKI